MIAEFLAAGLAGILDLPVPAPAVIDLPAGFGSGEPDPEIQDLLRGSVGDNFGLTYLPGALGFDVAVDLPTVDPALAAAVVWFDAFLTNPDRTLRNPNILLWNSRIWLIDHGASLFFHHRWDGWERRAPAEFPRIREHVLLSRAGSLTDADALLRPRVSEAVIRSVVADLPDEWLSGETYFPDLAAHREAYVTYLLSRLANHQFWLQKAIDAVHGN